MSDLAGTAGPRPWPGRVVRWPAHRGPGPDGLDVLLVLVCFGGFTAPILAGVIEGEGSTAAVAGLGALAAAPLLVRRRLPLVVLAVVTAVLVLASLTGVRFTPFVSNAGPVFGAAVLTAADRSPRSRSLPAVVLAVVAVCVAAGVATVAYAEQEQNLVQLAVAVPCWVIGDGLRSRREFRIRTAEADRRHAEDVEQRVRAEERLRVARDVHDVVSHALGVIAVRSGVARLLLAERPAEAGAALAAIETTSRTALDELRVVLHHLREDPPRLVAEPVLADLDELVAGFRRDVREIEVHRGGHPRPCPPLVEATAYRVVQEALTNVVRHAGPAGVRLAVRYEPDSLLVSVVDDGPGVPGTSGDGLGLLGMRERVDLLGGELVTGPGEDGGFAVVARFPLDVT